MNSQLPLLRLRRRHTETQCEDCGSTPVYRQHIPAIAKAIHEQREHGHRDGQRSQMEDAVDIAHTDTSPFMIERTSANNRGQEGQPMQWYAQPAFWKRS